MGADLLRHALQCGPDLGGSPDAALVIGTTCDSLGLACLGADLAQDRGALDGAAAAEQGADHRLLRREPALDRHVVVAHRPHPRVPAILHLIQELINRGFGWPIAAPASRLLTLSVAACIAGLVLTGPTLWMVA